MMRFNNTADLDSADFNPALSYENVLNAIDSKIDIIEDDFINEEETYE